jgi:multiple sugar transport system permease protein
MAVTEARARPPVVARRKKKSAWPAVRGWLFIGPVVLGTLLFNVLPMIPTIYTSFTNWDGISSPQWAGFANYSRIFSGGDPEFMKSLINTIIYAVVYVPVGIAVGLVLALLVNRKARGIVLFRALFFMPVVTSLVAIGMVWRWIFDDQYGVLNWLLSLVGITGPHWLGEPVSAMIAVMITGVWAIMGYNMVILLAGLQSVPAELLDSAKVDGAGALNRFRHVMLPVLTPALFFLLILSTIGSFQVFGLIFVMTSGGPGDSTYVYIYELWYQSFQLRKMGFGSAMAVLLFLVLGVITWIQWRLSKRWVFYQ